jgi:hypothetical protein
MMRRKHLSLRSAASFGLAALLLAMLVPAGCGDSEVSAPARADQFEASTAIAWMDLLCGLLENEELSPPESSRVCAYTGVTLYEAVVGGMPEHGSLAGQLKGMPEMPQPEAGAQYDWPCCAAAALSTVTAGLFEGRSPQALAAIEGLRASQLEEREAGDIAAAVVERSVEYGDRVAEAVMGWAGEDGYAERRGLAYVPPAGPDKWVPTLPEFAPALEPYWGQLRPFVVEPADPCAPAPPLAYSEAPGSAFHLEVLAVYEAVNGLDEEQLAIARFWGDNPGESCTPPGHWLSIENQLAEITEMRLDEAAEMYALAGIAMGDAFICCWTEKYRYNLLRPVTYIQSHIDAGWVPPLATPPFPEYVSGHSVVSGAASRVLSCLVGEVAFTDHTHDDAGYAPRSFESVGEAAAEAAVSRLYGGIHYPMAIDEGLAQGECVGQMIIDSVCTRR